MKLNQSVMAALISVLIWLPGANVLANTVDVRADNAKIVQTGSMWNDFQYGRPGVYAEYFEEFYTYTAADWTVIETVSPIASEGTSDAAGGVLRITNSATDDDSVGMQLSGETFLPTSNKNIFCEFKVKISDATQTDFLVGLVVRDISPLAHTDGIVFRKDDGDTNWDFATTASSTSSEETGIATADTDYIKLGVKVSGTNSVTYWVNDSQAGSFDTNIPATELTPTIVLKNGEGTAKTADVQHILCAQEL